MYRDLSVFWFLDTENSSEILPFLAEHRFFTVVYSIEFQEPDEPVKTIEPVVSPLPNSSGDLRSPSELVIGSATEGRNLALPSAVLRRPSALRPTQEEPVKPVFSYANALKKGIVTEENMDMGKTLSGANVLSATPESHWSIRSGSTASSEPIPSHYRGGKYNKTEFENVRDYYHKWGNARMFVMFGTRGIIFSRDDKVTIRNLMNTVVTDPKYQKIIRDNEYYFVKIVKNFHRDSRKLLSSLHFNIIFKNEYTASEVFHVYVNPERTQVTRISTLYVDNR